MEYIVSCTIKNVGVFEYYLTKTSAKNTITTYGIAIKCVNENYTESVDDIWTEKDTVINFIKIIAKNQVTCIHLKEICEEFAEELYSI